MWAASKIELLLNEFGKFLWRSRKSVNSGAALNIGPLAAFSHIIVVDITATLLSSRTHSPDRRTIHKSVLGSRVGPAEHFVRVFCCCVRQPLFYVSSPTESQFAIWVRSPSVWDGGGREGVGELVITVSRARETRRPSVNSHIEFKVPVIMW